MSAPSIASPLLSTTADVTTPTQAFNEEKYKKLKRKLRDIIGTNDSMLKQYEQTKKKIKTLTYERNLLLDNIARMEHMVSSDDNSSDLPSDISDSGDENEVKNSIKLLIKKQPKPRQRRRTKKEPNPSGRDQATVASAPPKRSKMSKVPAKTRRVQPIERDESGNPKLPQQIGVLTVLKLGSIEPHREAFHNERYIFPVGYTVSRTYPSMVDPVNNTVITSTIVDGGDGPRFHVEAADMPGQPIIANSATGAWTVVVRRSNEIRHRDHSNSASGPDYYGFKHPTIAKMIQDLPGAKDLEHYVWQPFEEMEPRAAKGVMAAALKKRGNLEQMGNANRKGAGGKAVEEDNNSDTTTAMTPLADDDTHLDHTIISPGDDGDDDDDDEDDDDDGEDDDDDIDLEGDDEMDYDDDDRSNLPLGPPHIPSVYPQSNEPDEEVDELGVSD